MKNGLILFLLVCGNTLAAQTKVFDMTVLGFKFGKMIVTRNVEPDSTEVYTLNASGKATVLWIDFVSQTKQEVRYKNGRLVSSSYTEIENGKTKRWNKVTFDGKKYQVDSYKGKSSFAEAPVFSVASLYFKNSTNLKKIFYEAEAEYAPVNHTGKENIEFKTSEGNRSVYHFINGEIQNMEFYISIAIVYMKRVS